MGQREDYDGKTIQTLAGELYELLRLHSEERKALLKMKHNLEAKKARKECAYNVDGMTLVPILHCTFSEEATQSFFSYSCEPHVDLFKTIHVDWLPIPPLPTTHFDDGPIIPEEISEVPKQTHHQAQLTEYPTKFSSTVPLY